MLSWDNEFSVGLRVFRTWLLQSVLQEPVLDMRERPAATPPASQLTPAGDNIRKLISLWGDRRGYYSFTSEIRSIQYPVRALYVHPPRPRPDNISLVEKFSNLFARKPQVSEQKETVW